MAIPATATLTLAAANAAIVAASQTPGAAGSLTLVGGGKVVLDAPRRVLVSCAGADASRVFTVFGTDRGGYAISENVAGTSASSAASLQDFATVTKVTVDAATAGAVTVGTNATASTKWFMVDHYRASFAVGLQGVVAAASPVTFVGEFTLDPVQPSVYESQPGHMPGSFPIPTALAITSIASGSTSIGGLHSIPCTAVRFTITAGTTAFTGTVCQAGLTP